jgi:hypothetical protein
MKKTTWLFLFITPIVLLLIALFTRKKPETIHNFEVQYTNTVSNWSNKVYVPMNPFDGIIEGLSKTKVIGTSKLTIEQSKKLTASILGWFKAYSDGNKDSYLQFRFPQGIPWKWKDGSLEKMSNYFINGIVFDSTELYDAWMRRYGNPDNIVHMVPYAEAAASWSPLKTKEVRVRWIAKYGDGSTSKAALHPQEPFDEWLRIAYDHSGTNWWLNYWTGVCFDQMIISIVEYNEVPKPLHQYPFAAIHHSTGFEANAPFENMGIGRMDRKSYIEWELTYKDLLQQQGTILTANIYCFFNRAAPETPEPALIRYVYVTQSAQWIPFEMDDAKVINGLTHTLYF